jgi:cytochrome c556
MNQELCPSCRVVQNMDVRITTRAETRDGIPKEIQTSSFQCASCHQFVRSEDKELSPV